MMSRPTNQRGFVLNAVLVMLGLFSVITVALLAMTLVAFRTSESHADSADQVRMADTAIERVLNDLRLDTSARAAGDGCSAAPTGPIRLTPPGGGPQVDVDITCDDAGTTADVRHIQLRSTIDGTTSAAARVRIVDEPRPGISLVTCDWQLGPSASGTLHDCV